MSLSYFSQLNIAMSANGASTDQFREMCSTLGKIAKRSRKSLYELTRFTVILLNQGVGKEEAIYKMKLFAGIK